MVAWWLRAVSLFNVLCVIAWCAWAWPRSPWLAAAGVVLAMLAGRLWLGLQFLVMQAWRRRLQLPPPDPNVVLRAWNAETHESARCFAWLMPWREHAVADHLPADAAGRTGVVLVHGWLCNRAVWTEAMRGLRARNIPFIAVSLPLFLHRIENARGTLEAAAKRMQSATGQRPLLVAHSMGGLVVRDWLRSLEGDAVDALHVPAEVVTIGSPHHGSLLAYCAGGTNVQQMRPGSRWLAQLQCDEARAGSAFARVHWHCVFSDCDNVVFPEATAQLGSAPSSSSPHSQSHSLAGYAHVQMLAAPQLWTLVRSLLNPR